MTTAHDTTPAPTSPHTVFSRVLVGIDGSPESREAARLAAVLTEGELTLLAVYDTVTALVATTGTTPPPYLDEDVQREAAEDALRRVQAELGEQPATGKITKGCSWEELIREVEREHDTLIAIGMGSTATKLIHKASCSTLVTRNGGKEFPRSIVVGVDGSPESAAAFAAARHLAERFGADLWPVVAHGGRGVDKRLTATIVGDRHEGMPDEPVRALVAASADADLLVVGSRGLHGLKALGSVSERVAHQANSPVLIVREPAWQRISEELEQ